METLIKADIFFFITSIFVALLVVGFAVVLIYFIAILKDMKYLSRKAKEEGEKIISDIDNVRDVVKNGKMKFKSFLEYAAFFLGIKKQKKSKK